MGFSFVQQAQARSTTNGTAASATFTATPASGNLLVADVWGYQSAGGAAITMPTGWTAVPSAGTTQPTAELGQFYKIAGASEPTAVAATLPTAATWAMVITEYNLGGITIGTPAGGGAFNAAGGAQATPTVTASAGGPTLAHCALGVRATGDAMTSQAINGAAPTDSTLVFGCLAVFDRIDTTGSGSYSGSLTSPNTTARFGAGIAVFTSNQPVLPAVEYVWTGSEAVAQAVYVWNGTIAS